MSSHLPSRIQQWETGQDGIDKLVLKTDAPIPGLGPEVIMGFYNHHKTSESESAGLVPCSDICGTIVAVGPGSSAWKIGDKCLSIFNQTHLKGQVAAAHMTSGLGLPLPGVLCEKGGTVLIQGMGGVAVMGLLIAKASGAKVIITSSSDSKLQRAKSLGADFLINYRTDPAWEKAAMEITKDAGADIIFENVGARTLRQSFDCIAFGGLINCIGYLSGKEDDPGNRTSTNVLALRRNVTMKGLLNGPKKRFEDMLGLFEKREIESVVSRTFEFGEAREALGYLFKGGYLGRWLLWFLIMKRWNGFT